MSKEPTLPPGLVGDLARWINETAGKPQPMLSLGASIAYVGALASKRYQAIDTTRPNIYCIGVGVSGCGKEHARKQIKRLSKAAGVDKLLGGEEVTSDAAIEMELARHDGRLLYMWDEIGHMFGAMKSQRASSSAQKIIPMLMRMSTSSSSMYGGKSYASKEDARTTIDQPHVCLYGTTVPGRLYEGMDSSEMSDGWLGRVLVFESKTDPLRNRRASHDDTIPQSLIDAVRAINEHRPDMSGFDDIAAATECCPTKIPFTVPADEQLDLWNQTYHEMKRTSILKKDGYEALWARGCEIGTKVALIIAAGDGAISITEEHADYGCQLFLDRMNEFIESAKGEVGDSEGERIRKKIFKVIKEGKEDGASLSEITRVSQSIDRRLRMNLLKELEDLDLAYEVLNEGRKGSRYYARKHRNESDFTDPA